MILVLVPIDSSSPDNFISESEINKNISEEYIYILDIVDDTCVDGPGLRTSVYSSGCSHKCPGCQNPKSWNLLAGRKMKVSDIKEYLIKSGRNITCSGGDPFFQVEAFTNLAKMIKKESNKNIWCYTGYTFEEIIRKRYRIRKDILLILALGWHNIFVAMLLCSPWVNST